MKHEAFETHAPLVGHEGPTRQICTVLIEAVLDGQLPMGAHVAVPQIARDLEVERTAVRVAIHQLARAGLFVGDTRSGFYVRRLEHEALAMMLDTRYEIELQALEHLINAGLRGLIPEICTHIEDMRRHAGTGDTIAFAASDIAFHKALVSCAGTARLSAAYQDIEAQLSVFVLFVGHLETDPLSLADSHIPIVQAIASADLEAAQDALALHLGDGCDQVLDALTPLEGSHDA